jgi:hypothetical protein
MIITAFGLSLTPEQWVKHSFCRVSANEIRQRIKQGMSERDAITAPPERPKDKRFKGISFHKKIKKWVAQIKVDGKVEFLGSFASDVDAAEAYDKRARELQRECNFK